MDKSIPHSNNFSHHHNPILAPLDKPIKATSDSTLTTPIQSIISTATHQSTIPWIASIQNILTRLRDTAKLGFRLEPIPALTRPFLSLLTRHTGASRYGGVEVSFVSGGSDLSGFKLIRSLLL